MDLRVSVSGRGAFYVRRSGTVRSRGAHRRENAGVSSETWVRIPRTENPRFPEEGSSALGKSGSKARPRGRDSCTYGMNDGVTEKASGSC